jgi:hypothetical protein
MGKDKKGILSYTLFREIKRRFEKFVPYRQPKEVFLPVQHFAKPGMTVFIIIPFQNQTFFIGQNDR